jgi:hypothetical protein
VPELACLRAAKHTRAPWEAPATELERAGVRLGDSYPHRIVTRPLPELRTRAEAALRDARAAHPELHDAGGYDVIDVPPGAAKGVDGGKVRVFTVPGVRGAGKASKGLVRAHCRGPSKGGSGGAEPGVRKRGRDGGRQGTLERRAHGRVEVTVGVPREAVQPGR